MSLGAILVGVAIAAVTMAYIARPFRAATPDVAALIEAWVRAVAAAAPAAARAEVNFCPQCGRRVAPDHRFCPGCGKRLPLDEDVV